MGGKTLKTVIIGLAAVCATSAFAADIRGTFPAEPPPPYMPVFSWTGFYVGAHVGYGWMSDDVQSQNLVSRNMGSFGRHSDSVLGGGQVGYNYQIGGSGVVLGLEGDVSATDLTAKGPLDLTVSRTQDFDTNKTDVDLVATLRGRLGYAFGRTLLYGTGGLAIRDGETTRTQFYTPTFGIPFSSRPYFVDKASDTPVGYTVGAGIEYAFADHWSVKAEYNYLHFEDIRATFPRGLRIVEDPTVFEPRRERFSEDFHLAKVGVNYRF